MRKFLFFIASCVVMFSFSSCAKFDNKVAADGQLFGSTTGDYVVVRNSGGIITDVWLIRDQIVQSEEGSDGWLFRDNYGNPVHIAGDMKSIRVTGNSEDFFSKFVEYHAENDIITYQEKFKKERGIK